jgi:hypothetical protein
VRAQRADDIDGEFALLFRIEGQMTKPWLRTFGGQTAIIRAHRPDHECPWARRPQFCARNF